MKCPHANDCALFPVFTQASFLKIWQASYCDGEYGRCARYLAVKAGEVVADSLLPNGKHLAAFVKDKPK